MAGSFGYNCIRCGRFRSSSNPKAKEQGTVCAVCDFDDPRHPQATPTPAAQRQLR